MSSKFLMDYCIALPSTFLWFSYFLEVGKLMKTVMKKIHGVSDEVVISSAKSCLPQLKEIYEGKANNSRYNLYVISKSRLKVYNLDRYCMIFSEELVMELSRIAETVIGSDKINQLDYLIDVLQPEMTNLVLQRILRINEDMADLIMSNGPITTKQGKILLPFGKQKDADGKCNFTKAYLQLYYL